MRLPPPPECGCAKPDLINDLVILPHDIAFMDTVVERLVYNVCRIQKGKGGYPTKYEPESDRGIERDNLLTSG